jgi:hypothetical protein
LCLTILRSQLIVEGHNGVVSQVINNEIGTIIIEGSRLAVKNLIKERKKTNGELVIMVKGKIKHIAAKDL